MIRVNLIAKDNGFGLSRNLTLLGDALRAGGIDVTVSGIRRGALRKFLQPVQLRAGSWLRRCSGRRTQRWDVNLMLERLRPEYLPTARHNILMPHPEWFDERDRPWLARLAGVFALTRHAVPVFQALALRAEFTGFTSEDRLDAAVPRERAFFHLAGRSANKGTDTLLSLWKNHPEWPHLTVLQSPRVTRPLVTATNITHRVDYIDDGELKRIQNAHRFHLCPSETEGFGHYLVEAMSVGALVLTLDAPPMHEMVTAARGVLIPSARTGRQSLATTYFYAPAALETAVARLLATPEPKLARMGAAARAWFEANDRDFKSRIVAAVQTLAAR